MLTKRIISCLDVKEGRVVKGIKFSNHKDAGDPITLANKYNSEGVDELVFYDITASSDNRNIMANIVSKVAEQVFIPLTVGGGLRTIEDMHQMLRAGADKISINTAAVENPTLIKEGAESFGSQCIVLGLDAIKTQPGQWKVRIRTGRDGGEDTGMDVLKWVHQATDLGVGEIVVNSIDQDGTGSGYDLDLLKIISNSVNVPVIASGGSGNATHMLEAVSIGKSDAVLAAGVFHYGKLTISEVKETLSNNGIPIRDI